MYNDSMIQPYWYKNAGEVSRKMIKLKNETGVWYQI